MLNTIKNQKDDCLQQYINFIESERTRENLNINTDTKLDVFFAMYAISLKAYSKANLFKRSAYQIYKMLHVFKSYKIYNSDYIRILTKKALRSLWYAADELNVFELNKRKKDFQTETVPLKYLLVDGEISRIQILAKELELKSNKTPEKLKEFYHELQITSPYSINYSVSARIYRLRLKATVNYETYKQFSNRFEPSSDERFKKYRKEYRKEYKKEYRKERKKECKKQLKERIREQAKERAKIKSILKFNYCDDIIRSIFFLNQEIKINTKLRHEILENLISESIFCLKETIRLSKTVGQTYLFNHSFIGSMHDKLFFWVRRYENYKIVYPTKQRKEIDKILERYLGQEWKEQLSAYYENQQTLTHFYKCLETHEEGRAYHSIIDRMCYITDDYNDRNDHFNIAEERHRILNGKIREKIKKAKDACYKDSSLYDIDNYFQIK
jgi:hypothetical protein